MRTITTFLIVLFISSCCIYNKSTNVLYQQQDSLSGYWEKQAQKWEMEDGLLVAYGENMNWAVLHTKDTMPTNYEVQLDVNMVDASLFELMPNINGSRYVRLYLYEIQQQVILGDGEYSTGVAGRPGGGISLKAETIEIKNNTWYHLKMVVINDVLSIEIDQHPLLEQSLKKLRLSTSGQFGILTNGKAQIKNLKVTDLTFSK